MTTIAVTRHGQGYVPLSQLGPEYLPLDRVLHDMLKRLCDPSVMPYYSGHCVGLSVGYTPEGDQEPTGWIRTVYSHTGFNRFLEDALRWLRNDGSELDDQARHARIRRMMLEATGQELSPEQWCAAFAMSDEDFCRIVAMRFLDPVASGS